MGLPFEKNTNNIDGMHKDIWAIWEHRNKIHDNCGAWCPSKKTPPGNPDANALPNHVCQAIRPVFERLTDRELLGQCRHGGTQNTNESFHQLIWDRCPKTSFVGRSRLALAVADATVVYNDGESGRLDIFRQFGMQPGFHTTKCFLELDKQRIKSGEAKLDPEERQLRRLASQQEQAGHKKQCHRGAF